jgi:hypothetical protein
MLSLHSYDRLLEFHRQDLLREEQHARLVAVFQAKRHSRPGIFAPVRLQLGRWFVAWGMKLQAFPADLTRIEYIIQTPTAQAQTATTTDGSIPA